MKTIKALGKTVILRTYAKSAGAEQKTESGLILPNLKESQIPEVTEIFQIGPDVPKGLFEIGDQTPFPLGEKIHVPHPDVIDGLCEPKDRDDKYTSVDYRFISCVYKNT